MAWSSVLKQTGQDETHCKGQQNPDLKNDEPHCLLLSLAQEEEARPPCP